METVQTENSSYVRDLHSKALINTDRVALENNSQWTRQQAQQRSERQIMKTKVDELNTMKEEILEIKVLLQQLSQKKEL